MLEAFLLLEVLEDGVQVAGLCLHRVKDQLAVSTAQYFGIIGSGKQYVLSVKRGVIEEVWSVETKDGVYDCAWSEAVNTHLAFVSGDGSVSLWDTKINKPLRKWTEHTAEVYSVDWNLVNKENIVTGSWDNTIKLWHPDEDRSIRTFKGHSQCVYSTIWHPKNPDMFASTAADKQLKIDHLHG